MGFLKWMLFLAFVAAVAIAAGVGFALYGGGGVTFTTPDIVPFNSTPVPSDQASQPSPAVLPAAVILPVPFTTQAPLNDWANKQHTCEEATLVMVDRYLKGDHSGGQIDPGTANAAINQITAWKPAEDLTDQQFGEMAKANLGYDYKIFEATRDNIKQQLALGRPVIVGVRTHGLGNPHYPGFSTHHEQAGWSVSHFIVVAGYDNADTVILNDPGISAGHGYHISFDQLFYAITDLDNAYPNLNQGLIVLVLAPPAK